MMNTFFAFASFAILSVCHSNSMGSNGHRTNDAISDKEWNEFKHTFGKKYKSREEENRRKDIFIHNKKIIEEHNSRGHAKFKMAVNHLTDSLPHEVITTIGKDKKYAQFHKQIRVASIHTIDPPDNFDWRTKNAISPVKEQGDCGSCWAFTATGSLESHYQIRSGRSVSLSEQYLVDCSRPNGNLGCDGGATTFAFDHIKENGIPTEESYPYTEQDGSCQKRPQMKGFKITGYIRTESGEEEHMKNALASRGPIAATIDGNHSTFNFYHSGIHYQPECKDNSPTHAVLVVGYGTEDGQDYWIVKNSWGPAWGDNGYIKMARNRDNNCGIASNTVYPELKIFDVENGQEVRCSSCGFLLWTVLLYTLWNH